MSKSSALLPSGLEDVLPPFAALEDKTIRKLIDCFACFGYAQIKPPLLEFEETLLSSGLNKKKNTNIFRFMDPLSQKMIAVRSDTTMQLSRVTATRLKDQTRPLRLSYAADVLRVKGSQLRPERQFRQVGCEFIGQDHVKAHVEICLIAIKSLCDLGIEDITLDLSMPQLVRVLLEDVVDEDDQDDFYEAVNKRDVGALLSKGSVGQLLADIVGLSGRAEYAFSMLKEFDLPEKAKEKIAKVHHVFLELKKALEAYHLEQKVMITLDPVEYRGLEYQDSPSFTLFAKNVRGELGRGGFYMTRFCPSNEHCSTEPATGFTLYMDTVLRALPDTEPETLLCISDDLEWNDIMALQKEGWSIKQCFDEVDASGCSHVYNNGEIKKL